MQNKKNNTPIIVGSHNVQLGRDLVFENQRKNGDKVLLGS